MELGKYSDLKKQGEVYHPECHDAGKLLHTPDRGLDRHWNFIDEMKEPWQWVIKQHHYVKEEDIIFLPNNEYVFLSIVADHLAAGTLRNEGKGGANYIVNKLWNRKQWDFENYRDAGVAQEKIIKEIREISIDELKKELVEFFRSEPKDFLIKYRDLLTRRADDAHGTTNIISLYIHSLITKKFYNILLEIIEEDDEVQDVINRVNGVLKERFKKDEKAIKEELKKLEDELGNKVKVNLLGVEILIPHYIFKVHDLNLYKRLIERIEKLRESYENNFFFFFGLRFVVMCGNQVYELIQEELERIADELKVYIMVSVNRLQLNQVSGKIAEIFGGEKMSKFLTNLPDEILGHLCEVCRMDRGEEYIEDDKVSYLCSRCKEIRESGKRENPFRKYAMWETGYVCAVNFKYLFDKMRDWIDGMYRDYLEEQKIDEKIQIKNHFPLVEEFIDDFKCVVKNAVEKSKKVFGEENVEVIFDDVFLVHYDGKGEIYDLFKIVGEVINERISSVNFCEFSPVKIYFSSGNVKYPFFMSYSKFGEDFPGNVAILIEGEHPVYLSFRQFFKFLEWGENILTINSFVRSAKIHQMLEIARVSESLARLKQVSDQLEDRGLGYGEMLEEMGYTGMLTMLKILDRYQKDREEK